MKPYPLKIEANKTETPGIVGNYVRLDTITGATALKVRTNTGDEVILKQGDWAKLKRFKSLMLSHEGAGEASVVLDVGDDTEGGSAQVTGQVSITPSANVGAVADLVVNAAGTGDLVANASRIEAHVYNTGGNVIRWGSPTAAPGAAAGGVIPPGMVAVIPTTGAVRFYNPGAAAITLNIGEVLQ